jgi:hypothetical protein
MGMGARRAKEIFQEILNLMKRRSALKESRPESGGVLRVA